MRKGRVLRLVLLVVAGVAPAPGQGTRNEIGLLLGAIKTPAATVRPAAGASAPLNIGSGLTFEATYARRLTSVSRPVSIYFEAPFVATPSTDVKSPFGATPRNYASLFVTPGVRLAFGAGGAIVPWLAAGGGYARFDESATRIDGSANMAARGKNSGAAQFGGGVDVRTPVRILFPVGLRAEIRDFYSGAPNFGAAADGRQHNVVFAGGVVLKF